MRILVTNDDGLTSMGIVTLANELAKEHEVHVVAPETQLSSIGAARTYNRPIRMWKWSGGLYSDSVSVYATDGTPSDAVFMGINMFKPEIVVSGVNLGENIGLESLFISGTIGAVIQSSLMGTPGIAASIEVPPHSKFIIPQISADYFSGIVKVVKGIINYIKVEGWVKGIDALSLNMPSPSRWNGGYAVVSHMAKRLFKESIIESSDPRGNKIYWRWGEELVQLNAGTDAYVFYREGKLTVTPIILGDSGSERNDAVKSVEELISKVMGFMA